MGDNHMKGKVDEKQNMLKRLQKDNFRMLVRNRWRPCNQSMELHQNDKILFKLKAFQHL